MNIASRDFTALEADQAGYSSSSYRISRRVLINNETLKNSKIYAGDVIAVFSTSVDPLTSLVSPNHIKLAFSFPF